MPTARDQAAGFLMFHQNVDFCDHCLAVVLGVSDQQAAAIAIDLGSGQAFLRDRWTCHRCGRMGRVIRSLANPTLTSRSSGRRLPPRLAAG
jgi:hypothetical protein